jgi:hypothetical protein
MSSWRSIATSLAVAAALLLAAMTTGCNEDGVEERVREYAARQLGVPEDNLRVTERSDLSTSRHAFLRVTARGRERHLTVAVARRGQFIVDALQPDAFARVARAEELGPRFQQLGGARVAGWYGALSGGRPCGEPFAASQHDAPSAVQVEPLGDGAYRLSYRFTDGTKLMRCRLTIEPDGSVLEAMAEAAPVAQNGTSGQRSR